MRLLATFLCIIFFDLLNLSSDKKQVIFWLCCTQSAAIGSSACYVSKLQYCILLLVYLNVKEAHTFACSLMFLWAFTQSSVIEPIHNWSNWICCFVHYFNCSSLCLKLGHILQIYLLYGIYRYMHITPMYIFIFWYLF